MNTTSRMQSAVGGAASLRPMVSARINASVGQLRAGSCRLAKQPELVGALTGWRQAAPSSLVVNSMSGGFDEDLSEGGMVDFEDEQGGDSTKSTFDDIVLGDIYEARVVNIVPFGVFIDIGAETDALVHISQLMDAFVKDINEFLQVGDMIQVKIIDKDEQRRRIGASIKQAGFPLKRKSFGF
ncbi:hypothetical protein BSKO_07284 [Bryopsis sp. KO-2023]|nr:hypothetical protein BSKO_07284 [Bryopsis sp. KO-2023]